MTVKNCNIFSAVKLYMYYLSISITISYSISISNSVHSPSCRSLDKDRNNLSGDTDKNVCTDFCERGVKEFSDTRLAGIELGSVETVRIRRDIRLRKRVGASLLDRLRLNGGQSLGGPGGSISGPNSDNTTRYASDSYQWPQQQQPPTTNQATSFQQSPQGQPQLQQHYQQRQAPFSGQQQPEYHSHHEAQYNQQQQKQSHISAPRQHSFSNPQHHQLHPKSSYSSDLINDQSSHQVHQHIPQDQAQARQPLRRNQPTAHQLPQSLNQPQHTPSAPAVDQHLNQLDLSQLDKDYIFEGLKKLYKKKVLPLELASKYSHFASPPLGPSDFEAKPMVVIIGQYSVGKTSFIRSLLKRDFPGQRIGPEPTTDRFTAIMHSSEGQDRLLPGHALVMQPDKPFRGLTGFGNNFLTKFEGAEVASPILRNITIVDTPGVLAGEKQRIGRDYDFCEVIKWFADRADMIIIMFDAHKLDISDELKTVLDALKPHQDKIKVLLNKADTIDAQALLRVYGALMWSLGKVVQTPEVCRVFLGSFWDNPLRLQDNKALLDREKGDLLRELNSLPQNAVVRRINELLKRARSVKVHAYIIHYLKKQMPYVIGKSEKQKKLLDRLEREFVACARRYNLPLGDFPPVDKYRQMLSEIKDITDFKRLDKNLVYEMDRVMTHDIPLLLQRATSMSSAHRGEI